MVTEGAFAIPVMNLTVVKAGSSEGIVEFYYDASYAKITPQDVIFWAMGQGVIEVAQRNPSLTKRTLNIVNSSMKFFKAVYPPATITFKSFFCRMGCFGKASCEAYVNGKRFAIANVTFAIIPN